MFQRNHDYGPELVKTTLYLHGEWKNSYTEPRTEIKPKGFQLYRTLYFLEQRWLWFPGLTSGTKTNKLKKLPKKTNGCELGAEFKNDPLLKLDSDIF